MTVLPGSRYAFRYEVVTVVFPISPNLLGG